MIVGEAFETSSPHVPNDCFGERGMHHRLDHAGHSPMAAGLFGIVSTDAGATVPETLRCRAPGFGLSRKA